MPQLRGGWFPALLGAALCVLPHIAVAQDVRAARQRAISEVLASDSLDVVNDIRASCASGSEADRVRQGREAGLALLPDAADYCVAALTHLGREGKLGFVRDARDDSTTAALAFDTGFVTAFRKREALTPDVPSMEAVRPIAKRCLAQQEANTKLCSAAGYVFGGRAYNGENVAAH